MLHGGRFCLLVPFPCCARERVPSWDASRHRELSVGAPCVKPSSRQLCLQRAGLNFVAEPHGVRSPLPQPRAGVSRSPGGAGHRSSTEQFAFPDGCDAARARQRAVPELGQSFGAIGAVLEGSCPVQRGTGRGWELTNSRGNQQQDKQPADGQSEALPSLWGQTDGTQVILARP